MNIILKVILFPILIVTGLLAAVCKGVLNVVCFFSKLLTALGMIGTVGAYFMLGKITGIIFGVFTLMIAVLPYVVGYMIIGVEDLNRALSNSISL
jgi:hypothetical protein